MSAKKRLRIPSFLLSALTAASALSACMAELPAFAAPSGDTDLTIDFSYGDNIPSVEDALKAMADGATDQREVGEDYFRSNYNQFHWRHARTWCSAMNYCEQANNGERYESLVKDSLRKYLISEDPADKYIALAADDFHEEHKRTPWETITITTDKVLDLNGHQLAIYYDRNRNHSDAEGYIYQNYHDPSAMNCVAFNITNGATLTIIDSSEWRGNGIGTGKIGFYGYMIDPYKYGILMHSTRDLFNVTNGNLVVYGGTFEAGRKKDQRKSKFTMSNIKSVIGSAVTLGVSIAEYASGVNTASGKYQDLLEQYADKAARDLPDTNAGNEVWDDRQSGPNTVNPHKNPTEEKKEDSPEKAGGRQQTVSEKKDQKNKDIADGKKQGTAEGDNQSNSNQTAKNDKNTKLAEAQNNIAKASLDKEKIMGMVDDAFDLVDKIADLFRPDVNTVTQHIKGTVVKLGNLGSFAAYGGRFIGYGSTPNTRNGVVEVTVAPGFASLHDSSKYQGGLAYIYGGTFEAYSGANVFNMVRAKNGAQYVYQYVRNGDSAAKPEDPVRQQLQESETNGVQVLMYENQDALDNDTTNSVTPIPIKTSNVQVRGGSFRCYYDLNNLTICEEGDSENFRKYPGLSGSVNLGPESYNNDLIRDGRIQIEDTCGDGALVLLDDRKEEVGEYEGLYHYRLFCGDIELRSKAYLRVYPNQAMTNSSYSMQLATMYEDNVITSKIFSDDVSKDNIRAPYRQTEYYFDVKIDSGILENYSLMPNFRNSTQGKMDVYGEYLADSEVWYYPEPQKVVKNGSSDSWAIGEVQYGEAYAVMQDYDNSTFTLHDRDLYYDQDWYTNINIHGRPETVKYYKDNHSNIRTNLHYFTYKVYRVDPLTRENISESGQYGVDEPLISVTYGASPDSLNCKFPLKEVERQIKEKRQSWKGYQPGEMYRVTLQVEERLSFGYQGNNSFATDLPAAVTETSILFRCYSSNELINDEGEYLATNFTPVQWKTQLLSAASYASINVVNAKAGMTDYRGDAKVFDLYYQWYETDVDGNPIRMIAGTDNVFDVVNGDLTQKRKHHPEEWNFWGGDADQYTYVNTVDPDDPLAATYAENGLPPIPSYAPIASNYWTDRMLHMYTSETVTGGDPRLKLDPQKRLSLSNNNVFATNTDSCYIPDELAGKYVRVKVIVLNTRWPVAYDMKQTFWSRPIYVQEKTYPLSAEASITYPEGLNYATCDKPATISVSKLSGMASDEKVTSVKYVVGGKVKEFTGLNITDPSQLPTVQYPADFYPEGYALFYISPGDRNIYISIETESQIAGNRFEQATLLYDDGLRFEREANEITALIDTKDYLLSDIQSGKYDSGILAFDSRLRVGGSSVNASVGYDYSAYTTTDADIVTLDQSGKIHFGGKIGTATVSVNGPDGNPVSVTVHVVNEFKTFDITVKNPPVVGETINPQVIIPEDAPYHITDVKVYRNGSQIGDNTVAEYFKNYRIEITALPNNDCRTVFTPDYRLSVELPDGYDQKTGNAWNDYDYTTWQCLDTYTFSYNYPAQSDHAAAVIDKIYIDFPTEVSENSSYSDWLDQVRVYTNGYDEGFDFIIGNTYAAGAEETAAAYGYDVGLMVGSEPQIRRFITGVQNGVTAEILIPDLLYSLGDKIAENVTVYVNGEPQADQYHIGSNHIFISAPDTLTVTSGEAPVAAPVFSMKPAYLVVGEEFCLDNLLQCSDPRVSVKMTGIVSSSNWEDYLTCNLDEGTVQPKQEMNGSRSITVTYKVLFDADGDNRSEYEANGNYYFSRIYASAADAPAVAESSGTVSIKMKNPDGSTAYSGNYPFTGKYLSVPELSNAFISKFSITQGSTIPNLKGGASRLYGTYTNGESLTAETVSVNDFEIYAGADCVYAFIKDQNGKDVEGIQISVDGQHFTGSDHITGLKPDTEYRLSIRQGVEGNVYYRSFRTAKQGYGVYIGRKPVTSENLGVLAEDGWHYDPASKTLTLKDFSLKDCGAAFNPYDFAGFGYTNHAVICSEDELTVRLIGENTITGISGSGLVNAGLYAENSLTVTGTGNLTVNYGSAFDVTTIGLMSLHGNIILNNSGKLNIGSVYYGLQVPDGSVNYQNGTIDYQPCLTTTESGTTYGMGMILSTSQKDAFDFSNKLHSVTVSVKGVTGSWRTISTSDIPSVINTSESYMRIVPQHTDNRQVVSPEYYASGSDDTTCYYHKSCSCGHIGTATFAAYDLNICGVQVTPSNYFDIDGGGHFSYTPSTKTLVISGNVTRPSGSAGVPLVLSGIEGLKIRVDSDVTLTGTAGTSPAPLMLLRGDTVITGTGSLILGSKTDAVIVRDSVLTVDGITVRAAASAGSCFLGENIYEGAKLVFRFAPLNLTFKNYAAYSFSGGIELEGTRITQPAKTKVSENSDGAYILLGSGNNVGSTKTVVAVASKELKASMVTLSKTSFAYTGGQVKVGSYISVKDGSTSLKYETDFKLSYTNNVNCGYQTASVTVTGIGEYAGTVTKTYSIYPAQQAAPALTFTDGKLHAAWSADSNTQGYQVQYCKDSGFTGDTLKTIAYATKTACDLEEPAAGETWYVRVRSYLKNGSSKYGFWSDAAVLTLSSPVDSITLSKSTFPYTGSHVKVGSYITVKSGGTKLKYGTDYTMSYDNNVNCGVNTAKVIVTGIGKYTGTVTKKYTIVPAPQNAPVLTNADGILHVKWIADSNAAGYQVQYCQNADFTGDTLHSSSFTPSAVEGDLKYGTVGSLWYVRVRSFITSSSGTKYGIWSDASSLMLGMPVDSVTLSKSAFPYTGNQVKVGSYITVKSGDTKLKYGTDFTMTYDENVSCGINTAKVIVTGIGQYTGTVTKKYSIYPAQQSAPVLSNASGILHAKWKKDSNAVGYQVQYCQNADFTGDTLHASVFGASVTEGNLKYGTSGKWYVRVRSYITNSSGTKYGFWSDPAELTLTAPIDSVTLSKSSFPYTGNPVKVGSYITVKSGETKLKYGTDFTMTYDKNTDCGVNTAEVTVTGIGNYTGTITKKYTIYPAQQAAPKLSTLNGKLHASWTADSNAQGYQVQYCQNADFTGDTLHASSFGTSVLEGNLKYGESGILWYVRVRAYVQNSSGTKYGEWSDASSLKVGKMSSVSLSQTTFTYTGNPIKVGSYITVKSGNTKLKYGTDFTLSYKNNTAKGTATVTVTGIGEYSGTLTKTYKIQ